MQSRYILLWALLLVFVSCRDKVTKIYNPPPDSVLMNALDREMHYTLVTENEKINLDLRVLDIETDSLVTLRKLAAKERSVFFFFSKFQCGDCVERELKFIKELYPDNTVIILAKEDSKRSLVILQKTRRIHQKMYLMNRDDSFNMTIENLNQPLFFRVNPLGQPFNLYSPKFSFPQFSKRYHATMVKQLTGQ